MLTSQGTLLAVAAHSGHLLRHGGRIVVLVVIVAIAVAIAVVLVRRARIRRRPDPHGGVPNRPAEAAPSPENAGPAAPKPTRDDPLATRRSAASGAPIVARGLTKHYGQKLAVNDLSFEVLPGKVTGFLGPNGAGKSTTMRMIMGLDRPDHGTVTIGGRAYGSLGLPLREVGALLDAGSIHPGRSAFAHLWMLARSNDIPKRRVSEVLDEVGLAAVAHQRCGQFSLGMNQRLGIAGALLGDPGVLLFDEPVNGLDTDGIRWVRQLLRGLASEGRTVFVSSHLMSEMAMTADHVVVIGRGRLITESSVADFTARNARSYVRVRSPRLDVLRPALEEAGAKIQTDGDDALAVRELSEEKIGEIAWGKSILLYELAPQAATLEDAFIESTEGDLEFHGDRPGLRTESGAGS
jgi:ABC-2 type transport system ATP-binding protein